MLFVNRWLLAFLPIRDMLSGHWKLVVLAVYHYEQAHGEIIKMAGVKI
jgi:hypothetical protein